MKKENPTEDSTEETVLPRFPEDYRLAQMIIAGNEKAWEIFSQEYRRVATNYCTRYYSQMLTVDDIEEICDGVLKRLTAKDFKGLRGYKGGKFSSFLTMHTRWEILDWIRRNMVKIKQVSLDGPQGSVDIDTRFGINDPGYDQIDEEIDRYKVKSLEKNIQLIPDTLPDDHVRWTFYLRFYEYLGFPLNEIRLLAKKRGVSIKDLTAQINTLLESGTDGLIATRREKHNDIERKLSNLFVGMVDCSKKIKKLEDELMNKSIEEDTKLVKKWKQLLSFRESLEGKEEKRERLLREYREGSLVITTPYELISEILGVDKVSTIRTWFMKALEKVQENMELKRRLEKPDEV